MLSLSNLESIMNAAQKEADIMTQTPDANPETPVSVSTTVTEPSPVSTTPPVSVPTAPPASVPTASPASVPTSATNSGEVPDLAKIRAGNMETIKSAMANADIPGVLAKITSDPGALGQMLDASKDVMTPELMEQARKFANGGQGGQILKEMQKQGVDTDTIRDQMKDQQKMMREMLASKPHKTIIHITSSRQLKSKNIACDSIQESACRFLKCKEPVELSCSRLATGSLTGKTIKIWYDPRQPSKNKRASKIVGFPVGGDLIIIMEEGDLNETQFLEIERSLV